MWQAWLERWQSFTNEQKISVVILGICGGLALGLSVYRVRTNVTRPFLVDKQEIVNAKQIIGETPEEVQARLKRTDTDGDTISDWDETNFTFTNPNLRDSCGDGIPDNVRIATGKGGGCGTGVSGALGSEAAGGADNVIPPSTAYPFGQDLITDQLPTSTTTVDGQTQKLQDLIPRDAKSIREALKGRVDQDKLDALSDEDLLKFYDQATEIQAGKSATQPSNTPSP
jgi:hypothetical protein